MTDTPIELELANVTYDVLKVPGPGTPLVVAAKKRVMETLVLDTMITDLGHIHHLLYVAFVGVRESAELSKKVSDIQYKYIQLCTDSSLSMKTMNRATGPILTRLHFFSKFLFQGKENIAFNFLHTCQKEARTMAIAAMDLSTRFNDLATEANDAQGDATIEQGTERKEAKIIQERLNKIDEDQASGKVRRDSLADEIVEAKQRYSAALEHEHEKETADRYMELAGMAMNMIGSCVGSASSAFVASKNPMAAMGGMQGMNQQPIVGQPVQVVAQQNMDGASLDPGFSSMGPIDIDNSSSLAALPGGSNGEPAQAYQAMDEHQFQQANVISIRANAMNAKPNPLPAQAAAAKTANTVRSESSKQLEMQMSLQKEQRELLGTLASLGEELKHKTTDKDYMQHAILAMNAAIGALKQVAGALETAGKNWHSFADELAGLGSTEMENTLKAATEGFPPPTAAATEGPPSPGMTKAELIEIKAAVYNDDETKKAILINFAAWQAIHLVAEEYSVEMDKAHQDARNSYEKNPTIEESRSLAEKLGAELAENAKQGMLVIDAQIDKTTKLKAVVDAGAS
jgi:hypothetical protein